MKRVFLKLSGEALAGEKHTGFDEPTVTEVAKQVKQIADNLCKTFSGWWDSILKCFGNKRVVHLAFHAKKKRTRKKNRNRLLKEFLRIMTLEGVKNDT